MKAQRGLTLIGFVFIAALVGAALLVAFRCVPAVAEYFTVKKNVNAIVKSGDARGGTVADIRRAYDLRAAVDETPSVAGADLDVSKDRGEVVIGFSYSRKVPLVANVSLVFDFEGSTSPAPAGEKP
jgi:hypothetical protein